MAAACRFESLLGEPNRALSGSAMHRTLSAIGSLGGRMMWASRGLSVRSAPTASQVRRSYASNRGDAPPSVAQKGKYTRGVSRENEPSRSRVTPAQVRRTGRSEALSKYYATCAPGLEKVLAAELSSPLINAQEVEVGSAGVSFVGTKETGYKAALWLRTAVRVLIQLAAAPLPHNTRHDPVYTFIRESVDWPSLLVANNPSARSYMFRNFVVQSRVWSCTEVSSSEFASLRAKDAICDAVRDACGGERPEPPEKGTVVDVPLFLSLYRDAAVLYRDLTGVSLHKRGYRDVMHKASLNEGIAAACLTIAGWNSAVTGFGDANKSNVVDREARVLLDPMCGSGTFLIEAALMASNSAPGLLRRQWPFQAWHDFDQSAWKQCKDAALSARLSSLPGGVRLLGNDIHEGALSLCKKDAKSAGVLHLLELTCEDCQSYHPPVVPSLVVTNPPWGTRLSHDDNSSSDGEREWLHGTWQALGRFLKEQCSLADVYVLSGNAEVTRAMHMRADKKWPVTVGGQERKLLHYHVLPPKAASRLEAVHQ